MMQNGMPALGTCPHCGGEFRVLGRIGDKIGTIAATDVLQWQCVACSHEEEELRRLVDGPVGDWPASRFAVAHTPVEY